MARHVSSPDSTSERTSRTSFAVELSSVTLVRGDQIILEDVSWRVKANEHWAVIGPNGSGKTTMLRIVAGYQWPSRGRVSVFGRDFGAVDLRELRRRIGWVSSTLQSQVPSWETALSTVLSGKFASIGLWNEYCREDSERAHELLDFMGCHECESRAFGMLSQGEQQRILIARALMPRPDLLILDEPCAGLDLLARERFLETIQELGRRKGGPTLIFVTHHIEEIVPAFSNILVFKSGRILAQGRRDRVLTEPILGDTFGVPLIITKINGRLWSRVQL